MTTPISQVARDLGISSRTLRYYEEKGLVRAQPRMEGTSRHYDDDEIARVARIRELQSVMGFNLDEIAEILSAEDRLAELRAEWTAGQPDDRRSEIVDEAIAINQRLQHQVRDKAERLTKFLDELDDNAKRYKRIRRELR